MSMSQDFKLGTLDEERDLHQRVRAGHKVSEVGGNGDKDTMELARVGKKQVLKRQFGLISMVGFECGLMCTWESLLIALNLGFSNGGPAGLIYGFIFIWAGTLSVFFCMGELASMSPTAAGQYHWVSMLAPDYGKKYVSYITGWITVLGWIAGVTGTAFFVGSLTVAIASTNNPDYHSTNWQGTMLLWALLIVAVLLNTVFSKFLPALEIFVLIFHIVGFFAIFIPLCSLGTHQSAHAVFQTWNNEGLWPSTGLAVFIGLSGNAIAFVGTDGAIHMSEEVKNSTINTPRSMIWSIMINGVTAFAMLIAVLFSAQNYDADIATGFPFVPILLNSTGSLSGTNVLVAIVIILQFCPAVGTIAAGSRMTWSFARDQGLPFSKFLSAVNKRWSIPFRSLMAVAISSFLLSIINIANATAFNDIVALILETFYTSYLLAVGLLLYRRIRGDIGVPDDSSSSPNLFTWGPWRVKGLLGIFNNIFACIYLIILSFFSYWPAGVNPTPQNMNYNTLVVGGLIIFATIYYHLHAKKYYKGPIIEISMHDLSS